MGRHRFEDQFKDKLGHREIAPSAGSWDKLSEQLNSEGKKHRPELWWIGIAATLLGAIIIAGIVYYTNPATDSPGMVESTVEVENKDKNEFFMEQEQLASEKNIITDPSKNDVAGTPLKAKTAPPRNQISEPTSIAEVKQENSPMSKQEIIVQNDEIISQKLEEIIAEVSMKDALAGNPTNDEIDALLYKAASEISVERRNIKSTGTVDAGDLLFAVEMELEETFREKVFDILKESYLKARTAVANRNY